MKTSTKYRTRNYKSPKIFYSLVLISLILITVLFTTYHDVFEKSKEEERKLNWETIHGNYFLDTEHLSSLALILNTSKCQVPDFDPWDDSMIPFIIKAEHVEDCRKNSYNWTYIDGNKLIVRVKTMQKDGYSFESGRCCYKIIRRIEQSKNQYDENADNLIGYSSCIPIIQEKTEILNEFIIVECSYSWSIFGFGVAYRGFHGMAQKKNSKKIKFWKQKEISVSENNLPPNIFVIGTDTTSRINFRRNMFKTREVLERLGAVEMFGYIKVGGNTFPNFCPIFNGYSQEDLQRICYFNATTSLDNCPFIWERFHKARYLTAHVEDSPTYTAFNYMKTGFVKQPVDFYSRTLFNAANDYGTALHLIRSTYVNCIGYETNDETIANYLENTIDFGARENTPIFALSWSTTLTHDNPNMIQIMDKTYTNLLKKLDRKGHLDNTILIFMGDHGNPFGPWRETLTGYYEDNLPNMWIRLPQTVKNKFPHWQTNLLNNQRRLASPYTLHWTLNKILDAYTTTKLMEDSLDFVTKKAIPKKYKQTFFDPIPLENSCEDIGVPEQFCPCYPLQKVELNDSNLIQAARMATQKINSDLNNKISKCSQLKVSTVSAGAVMNKTSVSYEILRYVVAFTTQPGGFRFESKIDFYPKNGSFSENPNVQRASKINRDDVKCVKDAKLELLCFCVS